jgi:kinesin family protein 13
VDFTHSDPFYESVENHKLIGVANVFMEALFHDVPLDYQVPIISQHGEVTGRLHIILQRIDGDLDRQNCYPLTTDDDSGSYVTCQLSIKDATGLPPSLANFVFCQYAFWGDIQPIVAAPDMAGSSTGKDSVTFAFNHTRQFKVRLSEEFIEHLVEGGALSIEIWGHRATGFTHGQNTWQVESLEAKSHSLGEFP